MITDYKHQKGNFRKKQIREKYEKQNHLCASRYCKKNNNSKEKQHVGMVKANDHIISVDKYNTINKYRDILKYKDVQKVVPKTEWDFITKNDNVNDTINLQLLCPKCHTIKSQDDSGDVADIKDIIHRNETDNFISVTKQQAADITGKTTSYTKQMKTKQKQITRHKPNRILNKNRRKSNNKNHQKKKKHKKGFLSGKQHGLMVNSYWKRKNKHRH